MIDGHWLSLPHLCYNCMKYLLGLSTSYLDALTTISPNVFPWKRLNYFQRSCASPLQHRKKCIHKLLSWHRWGPEWQSSRLQILLPGHVLSDGGTGRGSGGCHPGHSPAWLVAPLRGGSGQATNPCWGFGVWQQWQSQLEINLPAVIVLYCCAYLFPAGTRSERTKNRKSTCHGQHKIRSDLSLQYPPAVPCCSLTLSLLIFKMETCSHIM